MLRHLEGCCSMCNGWGTAGSEFEGSGSLHLVSDNNDGIGGEFENGRRVFTDCKSAMSRVKAKTHEHRNLESLRLSLCYHLHFICLSCPYHSFWYHKLRCTMGQSLLTMSGISIVDQRLVLNFWLHECWHLNR